MRLRFFWNKKKKDIELLKAEMDFLWKWFLILNGIFLLGISQILIFEWIANFFEVLLLLMVLLYFYAIVKIILKYFKSHDQLITLLEK